jgi:hypothetical protein
MYGSGQLYSFAIQGAGVYIEEVEPLLRNNLEAAQETGVCV